MFRALHFCREYLPKILVIFQISIAVVPILLVFINIKFSYAKVFGSDLHRFATYLRSKVLTTKKLGNFISTEKSSGRKILRKRKLDFKMCSNEKISCPIMVPQIIISQSQFYCPQLNQWLWKRDALNRNQMCAFSKEMLN